MAKKVFILPIETAVRELDYKLALSLKLAKAGHRVFIGSKSNISILMNCFSNFNYLDKGYHLGVSEGLHKQISNSSGDIFSLDEEGAVDFKDNSSLLSRYGPGCFDRPKKIFFWGAQQFKNYSKNNSKSIISGHPRFQMLDSKFHKLYEEEKNNILANYGDFILINTNMSFGNNIRNKRFVINNYGHRFRNINKIINQDLQKIDEICKTVILLSKNGYKIVLRPHPEESFQIYESKFRDLPNISIINSGGAVPWIMAAKQIIHTDCTTAIESSWIGKKPISIMPSNIDTNYTCPLPIMLSKKSSSSNIVNDIKDIDGLIFNKNEILYNYFSFSHNSLDIVCNSLSSDGRDNPNVNYILLKLKVLKRSLTSVYKKNDKLIETKLRGFEKNNLTTKINLIADILNTKANFKVKKHTSYFYEISSNSKC